LPVSNVLYYELRDGSWFCIRPSGTEPKLKIYFGVSGPSADKAEQKLGKIRESVVAAIKKLLY
jgi:phosphoglucomutase